jgi:hypothetical protein
MVTQHVVTWKLYRVIGLHDRYNMRIVLLPATRSVYGLLGLPGLGSRQRQKASKLALEKTPAVSLAIRRHGSEADHSPLSSAPVKEAGAAFPLLTRILMTRCLGNSEDIQSVYHHLTHSQEVRSRDTAQLLTNINYAQFMKPFVIQLSRTSVPFRPNILISPEHRLQT